MSPPTTVEEACEIYPVPKVESPPTSKVEEAWIGEPLTINPLENDEEAVPMSPPDEVMENSVE